ncbi:MAG: hypothetical protein PUD61_08055, partial [Prevotella sp.]|nr:hypothetical protein [Prevotella sp.]
HPGLFHVVDGRPAKGKSVDNGRTDNAFALTARRDNNPLHPRVSLRSTLGYVLLGFQPAFSSIQVE